MKKDKDIFFVVDGMRGLAAILIAMRHSSALLGGLDFEKSYLAVDLFFVLSGVVIVTAYEDKIRAGMSFGQFAAARFKRLFPMLLVGVALGAAVGLATGQVTGWTVWPHVLLSLMFLPNPADGPLLFPLNGPMWSLFFEMVVNAVFFLGISKIKGAKLCVLVVGAGLMLVAAVLIYPSHHLDKGSTLNAIPIGLLRCVFSFYVGVALARAYRASGRPALAPGRVNVVTAITLAVSVACLMFDQRLPAGLWDLICILVLFPALVFVAIRLRPRGWLQRFCALSGAISYPLYVIHEPMARFCTQLSAAHGGRLAGLAPPMSGVLLIAALTGGALVLDVAAPRATRWVSAAAQTWRWRKIPIGVTD